MLLPFYGRFVNRPYILPPVLPAWWAQVDFESRSAFTAYTFVEALGEPLVHATGARVARLVGSSGLEPPTSCLSGTRSNLLSYEPMSLYEAFSFTAVLAGLVEMKGIEPLTPCLQGRCSPS